MAEVGSKLEPRPEGIKRRGRGRIIFPELPAIEEEAPKITTIYEPEEIVSMNTGEVDLS